MTKTAVEETTTDEGVNRIGAMHEAFATYVNEHTEESVTAEQVFAVISNRVRFRKSESYLVGVKAAKEQEKADKIAAHETAVAGRKADQLKAKAEKEAEKAEAAKVKAEAAKVKADEKAAKDAEKAAAVAEKAAKATEAGAEVPATTTKKKKRSNKSASADADKAADAPF